MPPTAKVREVTQQQKKASLVLVYLHIQQLDAWQHGEAHLQQGHHQLARRSLQVLQGYMGGWRVSGK